MGGRIWLNMQDLESVNEGLKSAITDFEDVASENKDAQDAVGSPMGRYELRAKVRDFEHDWNDTRKKLSDGLTSLQEKIQGIVDGYHDYDTELSQNLTVEDKEQLSMAGPDNTPAAR